MKKIAFVLSFLVFQAQASDITQAEVSRDRPAADCAKVLVEKIVGQFSNNLLLGRGELEAMPDGDGFHYLVKNNNFTAKVKLEMLAGKDDISCHLFTDTDIKRVYNPPFWRQVQSKQQRTVLTVRDNEGKKLYELIVPIVTHTVSVDATTVGGANSGINGGKREKRVSSLKSILDFDDYKLKSY